ncbi:hypothetical protein EAL2_c03440 [Peptoclostridium acidaminophilum DSM 3953]|uniref:DUF6449 domain-containing protein n=2 Tax=Peptoclostridium acidaminophilum TaxID=1731 RepID=W8THL6_PEPAC|nr:hypothetical protein EAL2_c03440 [Peptoclostridium acidaminophilum DSM 3953]
MRLKTSLFSRAVFLNDMKRFAWAFIGYFVMLSFAMPIQLIMKAGYLEEQGTYNPFEDIFRFGGFDVMLMAVVPVLAGVFLFRYMQSRRSADMYHSLPLGRDAIFNSKLAVGALLCLLPVVATGVICIALRSYIGLQEYFTFNAVLNWMYISVLFNMTLFLASVLVGMTTGISVMHWALTYIYLLLPVGLSALLVFNIKPFMHGFSEEYYLTEKVMYFSPLARMAELGSRFTMKPVEIGAYVAASTVMAAIAGLLYRARSTESYSRAVAFDVFEPVFRYGVTFCSMLLGGFFFGQTGNSMGWMIFGYVAGSVIGYLIVQMMLKRSLVIMDARTLAGYAGFAAAAVLIFGGMKLDITGFEKRIPQAGEVDRVYFGYGIYNYINGYEEAPFYTSEDNIKNVIAMHRKMAGDKKYLGSWGSGTGYASIGIVYELEGGKRLVRNYNVKLDEYSEFLKPVYESVEYKRANYRILTVAPEYVDKITLRPTQKSGNGISIVDNSEIKEFIELANKDIKEASFEELENTRGCSSSVSLLLSNNKSIDFMYNKGFENTRRWLEQKGYLSRAVLVPEDVSHIVVEKRTHEDAYSIEENEIKDNKSIKRFESRDKQQIAVCLDNLSDSYEPGHPYIIGIYTSGGDSFYATFDEESVPDFVESYFK